MTYSVDTPHAPLEIDITTCNKQHFQGFRWALALMAKMLVRTITEGSTIVMKAINSNRALLCIVLDVRSGSTQCRILTQS